MQSRCSPDLSFKSSTGISCVTYIQSTLIQTPNLPRSLTVSLLNSIILTRFFSINSHIPIQTLKHHCLDRLPLMHFPWGTGRFSSLPRTFPALLMLRTLLYKSHGPSCNPRALHFLASVNTKSFSRPSFWIKPRVLNKDFDHFRVGFSTNFAAMTGTSSEQYSSVHDLTVKDIRGNDVDLSIYKGKVLLIVNVASQCGLTTSNYTELNEVYAKYKDQGLEILAFPCNQFGGQEPGDNEQIAEVACTRFKAEFPIFDKVEVNGSSAAPVYKFLKSSKGGIFGKDIKWNFTKFLVDKDGNVVERYAPTTSPLSIEKDVKKLLGMA